MVRVSENDLAQMRYLVEQFRTRLIDVAMDQVLQVAGLTLEQRQDLVGFPHLPHVIPGRTEYLDAVPYQRDEHHHDRRVQRRDRENSPADRYRANQPDDCEWPRAAALIDASAASSCWRVPGTKFIPPCEFVRSTAPQRGHVALLRRLAPPLLRRACGRSRSRS